MIPARLRPPAALLAAALLGLAGCASAPSLDDLGPTRAPTNFRGPAAWPAEIRRVAVLPAHDATGRLTSDFIAAYDAAWGRALAASQRAEFIAVPRSRVVDWTGRETLDSTSPLPPGFLERVAGATGAQAVLLLDLTHVNPYPPLALAFRARLATPGDEATVWMVDEIFDTRDAASARAARRDARAQSGGIGDPTHAVLQSPSRFADHAFRAVAALLPPRLAPEKDRELPAKKFPVRADNTDRQSNGVPSQADSGLTVQPTE